MYRYIKFSMALRIFYSFLFLFYFFNTHAKQLFVNVNTGNDLNNGLSATQGSGFNGPTKSINAAMALAGSNDTLWIAQGIYVESILIDKPLYLFGNNRGINPVSATRKTETILINPKYSIMNDPAGNSLISIRSCCVSIDGLLLLGDNPDTTTSKGKYTKEFETSFGISAVGNYGFLNLKNLIIRSFYRSLIYLESGSLPVKNSSISQCVLRCGESASSAVVMKKNFYADLDNNLIDSVGYGIYIDSFSSKSNRSHKLKNLAIHSELGGINLQNFTGNTDSLFLENNEVSAFDALSPGTGIKLSLIGSNGYIGLHSNKIQETYIGIYLDRISDIPQISFTSNKLEKGTYGYSFQQSLLNPTVSYTIQNTEISGMKEEGIHALSPGNSILFNLQNSGIVDCEKALCSYGNVGIQLNTISFTNINSYYIFLDSTFNGLKPAGYIDAESCSFEGISGNSLSNTEGRNVEDKLKHFLDHPGLAYIDFKKKNAFVTGFDGNKSLARAVQIVDTNATIHYDKINNTENILIGKSLEINCHPMSSTGAFILNNSNVVLSLRGKILLNNGLTLNDGIIELNPDDTLIVERKESGTFLSSGNSKSYVRGNLLIRYSSFSANYQILDTFPIATGNDFRPVHIAAIWPAGLVSYTLGTKVVNGKATIHKLPLEITHISDIRYWELFNPYNQKEFLLTKVGVKYASTLTNDLVNDPANLRLIFDNGILTSNLEGNGNAGNTGWISSNSGNPGMGWYTLGNFLGGNNMLSATEVIAKIIEFGSKCSNDSIDFTSVLSRSFRPIIKHEWSFSGPSFIPGENNSNYLRRLFDVPGIYEVRLVVTNNLGRSDTATQNIEIFGTPQMNYSKHIPCFPSAVTFRNTSGLPTGSSIKESIWKLNEKAFNTNDLLYVPDSAGELKGYFKILLNNGCKDSIFINETIKNSPEIKFKPNGLVKICKGDSIYIKITRSPGLVVWNDGMDHDSLLIKTDAFYKATNYANADCYSEDSIHVQILEVPVADAGPDLKVIPGADIEIKGKSNGFVEWTPDKWLSDATIINPVCRPLTTTEYQLRAYSPNGCESFDTVLVQVSKDDYQNIPNLLTPNGDGHNDKWILSNIPDPENCKVEIFTREGQNVFSSESYKNDFEGYNNGSKLNDGYYVYVVKYKPTGKVYTGILSILN